MDIPLDVVRDDRGIVSVHVRVEGNRNLGRRGFSLHDTRIELRRNDFARWAPIRGE
jgi:hypothetical protein